MRSVVIIKRYGTAFQGSAHGRFGGGFSYAMAGRDCHEAAAFAAENMVNYASRNPEGGDLMAPPEVLELVPKHLHLIAAK